MTDAVAKIEQIITPLIESMGYDLVRVLFMGARSGATLQIMAERKDRAVMTVDDCADISHAVSALLDAEDPIPDAYNLEVSSPGLDRPLVRPADFVRFVGEEIKLETRLPIDGRRRFAGVLQGMDSDQVLLKMDKDEQVALPFADIAKANIVITDALLKRAKNNEIKSA
jgi:ribosome maturation factor RimP